MAIQEEVHALPPDRSKPFAGKTRLFKRMVGSGSRGALLVCYYPLGDPLVGADLSRVYCDGGVDILEIGLPSKNPYLDGPDVKASMTRAAENDPRRALDGVLAHLNQVLAPPAALLMTYADQNHPALGDGSSWRGVDGLMVVARPDDPTRRILETEAAANHVARSAFVPLPVAVEDCQAAAAADGYVMLQAASGLTGPRETVDAGNRARIARLRASGISAPILLGFGISNGRQAAEALELGADGVVVGSHCLRAAIAGPSALRAVLDDLRRGLDG